MPTGAGVPIIPQAQLELGPAGWWRPEPENPAGNQIRVKAGVAFSFMVKRPTGKSTRIPNRKAIGAKAHLMIANTPNSNFTSRIQK